MSEDDETYGQKLRRKGIGMLSVPGGTQDARFDPTPRPMQDPSWEKGIVTEPRPGGTRMPILDEKLNPVRVKEGGERRREIEAKRRRQITAPTTQE